MVSSRAKSSFDVRRILHIGKGPYKMQVFKNFTKVLRKTEKKKNSSNSKILQNSLVSANQLFNRCLKKCSGAGTVGQSNAL